MSKPRHRKPFRCWLRGRRHDTYYPDGQGGEIYDDLTMRCRDCRWQRTWPGLVYER